MSHKRQGGKLSKLPPETREAIVSMVDDAEEGLSCLAAAEKVKELYGVSVTSLGLWAFCKPYLLQRQAARAVSQYSSVVSLSDKQRGTIRQGIKDHARLNILTLLNESPLNEESNKSLARLLSTIDSCDRTELATQAHELSVKADRRAELAIALQAREQDRKDESLRLEREKFEETNRRMEKARKLIAEAPTDGGMPANLMTKIEDTLCGRA